ncbi:MAG: alpha/beta fold hydrolase [Myxococcales bacterium]|nr:alpha/beta fold hydrolase [Myxococcales bacterium]
MHSPSRNVTGRLSGHFWTVVQPWHRKRPAHEACGWSTTVEDHQLGRVALSGALWDDETTDHLVVLVHGMGGHANSAYMHPAARHIEMRHLACLRLNLRGADRSGEDMYHSGLTSDLHAALADPSLKRFRHISIIGFSLGGHMVLKFATEHHDARVRGVVAISAPLDLDRVAYHLDRPSLWPYRRYLLAAVTEIYAAVSQRRRMPISLTEVKRTRSVRRWDNLVLVPRYGFKNAEDYYAQMSVGTRLSTLRVRALLVHSENDPLVPHESLVEALGCASPLLDVRVQQGGGHVNFPSRFDLGESAPRGLFPQILQWCHT